MLQNALDARALRAENVDASRADRCEARYRVRTSIIGRSPRHAGGVRPRSTRSRPAAPPCSSPARAAPARSWWRAPSTATRRAPTSPFVAVNCAATSARRCSRASSSATSSGAFTGARRRRKQGCFELADGGTLFLDEIGDDPGRDAGQAAARAAGARVRARWAAMETDPGRRAHRRRHQRGPGDGGRGRALPRGPLLPPQRRQLRLPPLRERARGHPAAASSTSSSKYAEENGTAAARAPPEAVDALMELRLAGQRARARERDRARRRAEHGQHGSAPTGSRERTQGRRASSCRTSSCRPRASRSRK